MKNVVFISGNFDVLHVGHLRLFKHAKILGKKLIVGLHRDGDPEFCPRESFDLRREALTSVKYIDEIIGIDGSIPATLLQIKPDIVLKGSEFESAVNSEEEIVRSYGGLLKFGSGDTFLFADDGPAYKGEAHFEYLESVPSDYLLKHSITKKRLLDILSGFSSRKITIVGDSIVDEYIDCEPLGMSQEDPTLVVKPLTSKRYAGGAAIVAAHASEMGAAVYFHSVIGKDNAGRFLKKKLTEYNVDLRLIVDDDRPTTLKTRYRAKGKTLLRVSEVYQGDLGPKVSTRLSRDVHKSIRDSNFLVFSDFNYGCLTDKIINECSSLAREAGILCSGDSQSSSQIGNVLRFPDLTLLSATEREARIALRDYKDGLAVIGNELRNKARSRNVFLKLGESGVIVFSKEDGQEVTDTLPALNTEAKDCSGAGDSMLTSASLALAAGATIWEAAVLGSLAAAIQVSRIGNRPVSRSELLAAIDSSKVLG